MTPYTDRLDMTNTKRPTRRRSATTRAAQALGRLGGRAGTPAQNAARKDNAQLAGRPRRVCVVCGAPVRGGHVDRALDDTCGMHGWRWQQGAKPNPASVVTLQALMGALESHVKAHPETWRADAAPTVAALLHRLRK